MMSADTRRSFPLRVACIGLIPLQHPHDSQPCFNSTSEWGHFVMEQVLKPEATQLSFHEDAKKNPPKTFGSL